MIETQRFKIEIERIEKRHDDELVEENTEDHYERRGAQQKRTITFTDEYRGSAQVQQQLRREYAQQCQYPSCWVSSRHDRPRARLIAIGRSTRKRYRRSHHRARSARLGRERELLEVTHSSHSQAGEFFVISSTPTKRENPSDPVQSSIKVHAQKLIAKIQR